MSDRAIRSITIADDDWMRSENDDDHLTAILVINGTFHHLEAIRVIEDDDGIQGAASDAWSTALDAMYEIGGDGPFDTIAIRGGTYVVTVIPFQ
ncbi:MAG TPA: hypothetical protein VF883_23430 [Thermoanaerobaculia bacterium]|jgi:hypothetical protein